LTSLAAPRLDRPTWLRLNAGPTKDGEPERTTARTAAEPGRGARAASPSVLGLLFLVLFISNIYAPAPAKFGPIPFPFPLCGLAAAYFYLMRLGDIGLSATIKIGIILLAAALASVFSSAADDNLVGVLLGFINVAYSVLVGYAFYLELRNWDAKSLNRLFLCLVFILITGAALEVAGPLRGISDAVRAHIFVDDLLYVSSERDVGMLGFVRPKFFTLEPSYLGITISFLVLLGVLTAESLITVMVYFGLLAAALGVVGSPTIVLGGILAGVAWVLKPSRTVARKNGRLRQVGSRNIFMILVLMAGLVAIVIAVAAILLGERFEAMLTGRDGSFNIRFYGSFLITLEILKVDPVFGMGPGGKGEMTKAFLAGLSQITDDPYWYVENNRLHLLITNALLQQFATFGLFGGTMMFVASLSLFRELSGRGFIVLLAAMGGFALMMGGFTGARWWAFLFGICAVLEVVSRDGPGTPAGEAPAGAVSERKPTPWHDRPRPAFESGR
jgi:hypothetical protein